MSLAQRFAETFRDPATGLHGTANGVAPGNRGVALRLARGVRLDDSLRMDHAPTLPYLAGGNWEAAGARIGEKT